MNRVLGMTASSARLATAIACVLVGAVMIIPPGSVMSPAGNAAGAPAETTLRIGFLGTLSTLNPLMAYSDNDLFFSSLIYDSLTWVDQDLNSNKPNLAHSWWKVPESDPELVVSGEPYGSVVQYNLTNNAQWHDGAVFSADDVNYTLNVLSENWIDIWAYQPYTRYMHYSEKNGEYSLRVHFWDPRTLLSIPVAFSGALPIAILPKHVIQNLTVNQLAYSWNGTPVVGTGPFMARPSTYDEFLQGQNITLLRNPNYHFTADFGYQVHFDKLDLRFYDDEIALRDALMNSEIDVARFNYSNFAELEAGIRDGSYSNLAAMSGLRADGYFTALSFSMQDSWGNLARLDPYVRMALASTTDKTGLINEAYGGHGVNDSTLISPLYPDWQLFMVGELYPYDPVTAELLLNLFGYVDSDMDGILEAGPDSLTVQIGLEPEGTELSFDLLVRSDIPEDLIIARAVQAAYGSIGVNVVLMIRDPMAYSTALYGYAYDIAIVHWEQDPDPHMILFIQSTDSVNGWSDNAFSDVDYDENFSASISALNTSDRQVYVQNCQFWDYVLVPYYILGYLNQTYVARTDTFTGWGDWDAHPGRGLDAKWGANPLFFDLMPLAPNSAPVASFTVLPVTGDTATVFEFNASGSSDAEDPASALEVRWDWNDDGAWDTAWTTSKTAQQMFPTSGIHTVSLMVRDTGGLTNTTDVSVMVSSVVVPEFGSVLVPVLALALVALVLGRSRARLD